MKIAIIGANGKAGSLIADEAMTRGHEVTAIVRDKKKVDKKGFANVTECDIYDLSKGDLKGFDAVVSAVNLKPDEKQKEPYKKAVKHLIGILEELPDVRLLIVGGAASLYTDGKKEHQVLEQIPEQWSALPADMAKAYGKLQKSKINWTFFSPAITFDPKGERTGKYTLGSDFVITNAANESYISYQDYAVAMVDEIESKNHVGRRFTAVSDKPEEAQKKTEQAQVAPAPAPSKDEYYGIMKKKPEFYGLSRYRPPFLFELEGKQFKLVMDNEEDFFVNFVTGHTLEWSTYSQMERRREYYECTKIDELTYFVNFELTDYSPRTNITLILDMENRLVTFVRTYTGFSKKYPYLVESDFDFGAIDLPGYPLPTARHGYTADLVGKRINWTYAPHMSIVHVYYCTNYIRATFMPGSRAMMRELTPEQEEEMERFPYDEPTTYIKIKKGIYVVSVIEQHRSRRGDTGNSLLFLMDLERVHDVGRSFGNTPPSSGAIEPENYLFAAFGEFVYSDGEIESRENPYLKK